MRTRTRAARATWNSRMNIIIPMVHIPEAIHIMITAVTIIPAREAEQETETEQAWEAAVEREAEQETEQVMIRAATMIRMVPVIRTAIMVRWEAEILPAVIPAMVTVTAYISR